MIDKIVTDKKSQFLILKKRHFGGVKRTFWLLTKYQKFCPGKSFVSGKISCDFWSQHALNLMS